ncbi:MAG: peptidylprolyl isomerase [Bacteroidales bacterium]
MKTFRFSFLVLFFGVIILSCSKEDPDDNLPPCESNLLVDLGSDTLLLDKYTFTLDAGNPGSTFKWSTGETTQSITINDPGEYWVEVTDICSVTKSDTIKIDFKFRTIKIETGFGDMRIWLYDTTPLHKTNFLDLAGSTFYDGLIFHRVVEDFVIQGGDPEGTGYGGPGYTIPAEIVAGLSHVYGAVGAARLATSMESNGSQFYIVSDPDGESGLDGDYTVFGIVFDGLEVVYDISQVPVNSNQKPIDDVVMNHVIVELYTAQELVDNFSFVIPQ